VGRGIYKTSIDGSAKIPLWIPYHFISGDNLLAKTKVMAFFGDPFPISWINELGDTFIFMELFLIMFAEPRIKKMELLFFHNIVFNYQGLSTCPRPTIFQVLS